WATLKRYWQQETNENRMEIRKHLGADGIRTQYFTGVLNPERIAPESYTLDVCLVGRPGNMDIQLDLHLDYRSNVALYPKFHEYFRTHQPPLLAIWGKNDPFFIPPGAEGFKRDLPKAVVEFVDS